MHEQATTYRQQEPTDGSRRRRWMTVLSALSVAGLALFIVAAPPGEWWFALAGSAGLSLAVQTDEQRRAGAPFRRAHWLVWAQMALAVLAWLVS